MWRLWEYAGKIKNNPRLEDVTTVVTNVISYQESVPESSGLGEESEQI